ncbi:hypothetical protein GCM10010191_65810 [Actinomadura vinacea]|uniref:Uncharacterized protein n=1 Tax=Actinomadura vinacea TaxID=115336 RepID=A0ABP5X0D3_9ACTN
MLLTIGRFARLCLQLRHYDESGPLASVRMDAGSDYRYYALEQARDALTSPRAARWIFLCL